MPRARHGGCIAGQRMAADQQRIQALLDERAELIRELNEVAQHLGELLEAARKVRDAVRVSDAGSAAVLLAVLDLARVLDRFDDGSWGPRRRPVQSDLEGRR
jgi:hypothetical protein